MLCHQTLRVTPGDGAGLTDHVWSIADVVRLLEEVEAPQPGCLANPRHYAPGRVSTVTRLPPHPCQD
jgi:hypothetical protein